MSTKRSVPMEVSSYMTEVPPYHMTVYISSTHDKISAGKTGGWKVLKDQSHISEEVFFYLFVKCFCGHKKK